MSPLITGSKNPFKTVPLSYKNAEHYLGLDSISKLGALNTPNYYARVVHRLGHNSPPKNSQKGNSRKSNMYLISQGCSNDTAKTLNQYVSPHSSRNDHFRVTMMEIMMVRRELVGWLEQ